MALYFFRHGESSAQAKGIFAGDEDPPLTPLGRKQIEAAVTNLTSLNITEIISSPLQRATQSAEIIKLSLKLLSGIKVDDRLKEYDVGALKGEPLITMTPQKLLLTQDVEDPQAFYDRVYSFLRDNQHQPGNILVVSHSAVGRMVETIIGSKAAGSFYEVSAYPNAQPVLINLEAIKFTN